MIARSSTPRRKVSRRSIVAAIVMFVGILLLALGYYGGRRTFLYAGLVLFLLGVIEELLFGILLPKSRSLPHRGIR
jgi:hypothetical protein